MFYLLGIAALTWLKILVALFTAILMLQSGSDKLLDYSGNKAWLNDFFKNSPLKGTVAILLPTITFLELMTGLLSAIGAVMLFRDEPTIAFYATILAALSFIALFFGQRMAKDYAGAGNMTVYFIFSLLGILAYCI